MPKLKTMTALISLLWLSVPALAETAHNAQAGANGGTSNNCGATAYFPEGTGCLSSEAGGGLLDHDDAGLPRGAVLRRSRPLPSSNDDE